MLRQTLTKQILPCYISLCPILHGALTAALFLEAKWHQVSPQVAYITYGGEDKEIAMGAKLRA